MLMKISSVSHSVVSVLGINIKIPNRLKLNHGGMQPISCLLNHICQVANVSQETILKHKKAKI